MSAEFQFAVASEHHALRLVLDLLALEPIAYASHAIRPDNTWTSWTHTGSSYAALLVRPGFEPVPRLDVLPKIGGYVVARTVVEGMRK